MTIKPKHLNAQDCVPDRELCGKIFGNYAHQIKKEE